MSRSECNRAGIAILSMFRNEDRARYAVGDFEGRIDELDGLVDTWWENYKKWERTDTLAAAYSDQRLTVKGTSSMNQNIQAFSRSADPRQRYGGDKWDAETVRATRIVKTNASINARMNPEVFVPIGRGPSLKTDLGYHDLSALLLNPAAKISAQQYKTISDDQVFVFMPLSTAMDQAVFQNINQLAKASYGTTKPFYDKVRDIRARMTRIKLAAEHDMATKFVEVGQSPRRGGPRYKYTLSSTTDVSLRDEGANRVNAGTIKPLVTLDRVKEALKLADETLGAKRLNDLSAALIRVLKTEQLNMITDAEKFREELHERLFNTKQRFDYRPDWNGLPPPKPTPESLAEYEKFILDKCGGKTKSGVKTTPGIFQARQNAAINFQTLVLGQIMRYGEVTIAYRQHAADFPKFAKFDKGEGLWVVGTVDAQNQWTAGAERFQDRPA